MALENVEEFFAEAVNAVGETANAVVVVVVGGDCRNGGKEADGSGYQRLGNARRNNGETCVFKAREPRESVHDAPNRAEKTDVG